MRTTIRGLMALAALATLAAAPRGHAAELGDRVDLRVLVMAADGTESSFQAWTAALSREGVPFDTFLAESEDALTTADLQGSATHARYQAVVLATGDLIKCGAAGCLSTMDASEWAVLDAFQARFGIRRVVAYAYPQPQYGTNWPFWAGDAAGQTLQLTAAGSAAFPYLKGAVPIDVGSWSYFASPLADADVEVLVAGPVDAAGVASSAVGVHQHAAGFEEVVVSVATNPHQLHAQLLAHGLIRWATRGVYLGAYHNYFTMHIDDVFVGDDRWDTVNNTVHEDEGATIPVVRMAASDVTRALAWQSATGLVMDLVFNGAGSDEAIAANGSDALTTALLANRKAFRWINHTYTHLNLDNVGQATIEQEIKKNIQFANKRDLDIDKRELVTGQHSGLKNPAMAAALSKTKIKWIGADNSWEPTPYAIGSAVTVPRHPSNVYYNVGTFEEQLDEYNYLYFENCTNTATTTCLTAPATWQQYIDSEAAIMLRHVLNNDPRPHYFHQANLAEDGTMYAVVDRLLERYNALFAVPMVQPTFAESSQELSRQAAWAVAAGQVTAYVENGRMFLLSPVNVEAPVTGTWHGDAYGGDNSDWRKLKAGKVYKIALGADADCPYIGVLMKVIAKLSAKLASKPALGNNACWVKHYNDVFAELVALKLAQTTSCWL